MWQCGMQHVQCSNMGARYTVWNAGLDAACSNAAMWNAACAMTYVEAAGACAMQHFGMQQSGMQQQ